MTRTQLIKRVLYVVPMVGAMAFGTAQAFASSAPSREKAYACTTSQCYDYCGGPGTGACVAGRCICH